ncbi:rhomboid family intramembrane serine protease [Haoranjiania flava]|uniref:Rhomboid family intramembrane serine protease n=1 Tax=Haoranjiania flava TaxID=1856322 RepID=A0AAE3IKZ0_9BACT|nr:rhomboid family intramembrane serine protease [Haoranjiania flava]MCU7693708.1 rhomboid family intramembrane serine protease [Haoranjiania flava]
MITIIIIAITSIISFMAFNNQNLLDKLIFFPPAISKRGEWYRFFTCGFIHADMAHLFFNMFTLFIFGREIEDVFKAIFGIGLGSVLYLLLYLGALFFCLLPTYSKNSDNYYYRSLGASGAISAVVFAYMLINPMNYMGIVFIPLYMPAFLFGFIYIAISYYLDKKQAGNINHSAHLFGGFFGLIFTFAVFALLADINLINEFILKVRSTPLRGLIKFGY